MSGYKGFAALVSRNHTESALVLALAAAWAGLVLENFGSLIEGELFDKWLRSCPGCEDHLTDWYKYLRLAFRIEPIGHRYMRTLVLHLKFELNNSIGLASAGIGLLLIGEIGVWTRILFATFLFVLAIYLCFFEARRSHCALSELRREMLKGINVVG